jgi:hypothetical protein
MSTIIQSAVLAMKQAKIEILTLRAVLDEIRSDLLHMPQTDIIDRCISRIDDAVGPRT